MLDKNVAMNAQIFVAGSQAECGKRSSCAHGSVLESKELLNTLILLDTASVVTQRLAARESGDVEHIWNDVRFFGLEKTKGTKKPSTTSQHL